MEQWWAAIAREYPPWMVVVGGTFIVHQVAWLVFNLPYLLLDRFKLLQSYRIAADVRVSPIQSNPIQSNPIQSSYSFQSIWVEISITRARVGLVLDAASRSRAAAAAAHVAVVSAAGVRRLPYLTRSSFVVRRS